MLLTELVSLTSNEYVDYVEIFNIALDLSTIHLLALVGVELSMCVLLLVGGPSLGPPTKAMLLWLAGYMCMSRHRVPTSFPLGHLAPSEVSCLKRQTTLQ